jgi:hypothetical protein
MARLIPAAERITRARALIQKAYEHPVPAEGGKYDFSYIAQVKDYLRQAKDLVKFLSMNPGVSAEIKAEAKKIFEEADAANRRFSRDFQSVALCRLPPNLPRLEVCYHLTHENRFAEFWQSFARVQCPALCLTVMDYMDEHEQRKCLTLLTALMYNRCST